MTDHTPTPWEIDDDGPIVYLYAKIDKDSWQRGYVAYTTDFSSNAPHLANAQFIAKAVNNHDALVNALEQISQLTEALRQGGPDPMDLQGLSDALEIATSVAHDALTAVVGGPAHG